MDESIRSQRSATQGKFSGGGMPSRSGVQKQRASKVGRAVFQGFFALEAP
jgi:hypothetical protein